MKILLGAHMPASKGLARALYDGWEIGCTAVQVFTSSPQQWRGRKIADEEAQNFDDVRRKTGIGAVISHDCYLTNLAAPRSEIRDKSLKALTEEMERCDKLKIPYVVSHMGAHLGEGEAVGLKRLAQGVSRLLRATPESVSLALETTAGQGTTLGYRFEHLAYVLNENHGHPRIAVCLDTCHLFASGYDLRTRHAYEDTMEKFDSVIGLERLKVVHLNDSLKPLGSRVDRHAHIGKGHIGLEAFKLIVNDSRLQGIPMVVETPEADKMHQENVRILWSLVSKKRRRKR
jgi:deoxyribonuclease-4